MWCRHSKEVVVSISMISFVFSKKCRTIIFDQIIKVIVIIIIIVSRIIPTLYQLTTAVLDR